MNAEIVASNWALIVAAGILAPVVYLVTSQLIGSSAGGQLRNTRSALAEERQKFAKAQAVTSKAENRLDRLLNQPDDVKPRLLQEAKEALQDARELEKVAADRVLVAENYVRRVIHEEFAPAKQDRLRKKCLPESVPDRGPFTF